MLIQIFKYELLLDIFFCVVFYPARAYTEWNCEAYSDLLRQTIFDYTIYNFLLIPFLLSSLIWFHCGSTFFASLSIKDRKLCSIGGAILHPPFKRKKGSQSLWILHVAFSFGFNLLLRSFVESQKVIFMSSPKSSIFQPSVVFWTIAPVKTDPLFSLLMSAVFGNYSISANRLWSLYYTAEWMA